MTYPPNPVGGPAPKQGMSTGAKIGIGCSGCASAFLMLIMFGGCMAAFSGDAPSSPPATESSPPEKPSPFPSPEPSPTEEDEEPEEEAEEPEPVPEAEPGWDSDQIIDDIRNSLENGAFPELADIELRADDDDPGHVTVITDSDTPFLGDAGAIIGDTCEDVPELERVTLDHSEHGGATLGPVDTSCQG